MKIDSIDIRSFDAKQLTVDFEPPQTGVTVEMFDGALIPSESETYTPLSGLTVTVLFRGKDRDEVQKHVSDFNAELQKGVVLTLDGYSRHFKAYMTGNSLSKTITKTRYTAEFKFTGYWFSDEVSLNWQGAYEAIFEAQGNRATPCRLTITATEYIEQLRINGLSCGEIIIDTIPRGATVIIDGETGFATMDGENKFKDVSLMEFPYLTTGQEKEHHLIFSDNNALVTLQYKPIHHADNGGGQILVCVAGRGYYQEWGKDATLMKPGDCINIPAGVKHWHGAAPDSWFSHLAIEVPGENGSNEWLEALDDEQYGKLK